jgi:hypothetical protein
MKRDRQICEREIRVREMDKARERVRERVRVKGI